MRSGMLNCPFEAEAAREMFRARKLELTENRVAGNTLYLAARKI